MANLKGGSLIRPNVRYMTPASLFAALLAICAWICIPVSDIGITLQTFGVFLALSLLGGKWGSVSVLLYLLLGAVGLPVFSGFRGGMGHLVGVTGGFLWGFFLSALVYWALEKLGSKIAMLGGLLACYFCGCIWFYCYSGGGLVFILLRCVAPYVIFDLAKLWLADRLASRLKKVIKLPSRT